MSKRSENATRLAAALAEVMDCLNAMGNEAESAQVVRETLRQTHRTLQQSFMRTVIVPVVSEFKENYAAGWYDLRNEHSCALASHMLARMDDEDLYLPFV